MSIRTRGTSNYPKPSYNIETWSAPNVNLNASILGLPEENDWVLLASYTDRSLLRGFLSLKIHDRMDRYAPRFKYCELVVNNQYMGVYLFGEKIKRDSLRLNIASLKQSDNSGEELTGGYIWKIDDENNQGWISSIAPPFATTQQIKFQYEYPSSSDITPVQKAYIKAYVDSFEAALNSPNFQDTTIGWRKYGAVNSFIDFMIVNEFTRNYEAYRQNVYMYKDKSKKMRPGPLWGFDMALWNTTWCQTDRDTGWCYNFNSVCSNEAQLIPFWWNKLITDTAFVRELKCRYTDLRKPGQTLDTTRIFNTIDSIVTVLTAQSAIARNFTKWPIWGVNIINEPTPMATNYTDEIKNLKTYIRKRTIWLDSKWLSPGCAGAASTYDMDSEPLVVVYPNPTHEKFQVQLTLHQNLPLKIVLYNLQGNLIREFTTNHSEAIIDVSSYPRGVYFVKIQSERLHTIRKVIVD
jgi:CotH protein.